MKREGFGIANPEQYRRLLNSFPHAYLSDNPEARKTIPISLVHVFSCLGRHYGLDVFPVNFPSVVLARVHTWAPWGPDGFMSGSPIEGVDVSPSNAVMMLLRASRNMVASMRQREIGFAFSDAPLLLCPDDVEPLSLLRATGQLPCMECYTLSMALVPLLDEPPLLQEDREAITIPPKWRTEVDVKYFVGQVLRHTDIEYYGCIIGWDVSIFLFRLQFFLF
ncbi:hypothetical protein FA13DRAFT_1751438 [Coprinellus micaceus]|uniref:Hemimethylated DNA-binding domain-containing protein n=1 Tax=Coprinellus micaceus TaxID=71717 RepID=A0A4Y7TY28_COPMI|nr:hypothetical protein FA13DRAFT_1751438 [Coprinellus micaceus]